MPSHDLTITALWSVNYYRLVLNFVNGSEPEVRRIAFNDPIEYPEGIVNEGYKFSRWKPKPRTMPANDLVTKAQWNKMINVIIMTTDG